MSDYFVLEIENLTSEREEWLTELAFANGALGMSEVLAFEQPEGEETVYTKTSNTRHVQIYFQTTPPREILENLKATCPGLKTRVTGEANRDWLAEWKRGFKPFALAGGHWVIPSWCEPPAQAEHKIWIDPGMAFGTGTHETTQLVAESLVEILNQEKPETLLDVGSGTGILAILAEQCGVQQIQATEIETDARRVAQENFALNKCSKIRLDDRQIEDLTATYQIVVANIIDGVLVRLQKELQARVRPGGWLIVSGIITEREHEFLTGFRLPKAWELRRQKGDWLLFAVRL